MLFMRICLLYFLFFSIFSTTLFGFLPVTLNQYNFRVYEKEDGLPQNTVQSFIQDKKGYMWIGTQEGLAKFDGKNFKIFNRSNNPDFKHNSISSLFVDKDGVLWAGTYNGGITTVHDGVTKHFGEESGVPNSKICSIKQDNEGKIWIATSRDGIFRFNGNDKFSDFSKKLGLLSKEITDFSISSKGSFFIAYKRDGFSVYKNGKLVSYSEKDGLINNWVKKIKEDSSGNLLIGTEKGLDIFIDGAFISYTKKSSSLPSNSINTIYVRKNGEIIIGTSKGVVLFKNSKFFPFEEKDGLAGNNVQAIFEDSERNIWIGTYTGGITLFYRDKFIVFGKNDGISSSKVLTTIQTKRGDFWVGTNNDGLSYIKKDGTIINFARESSFSNKTILSLMEDSSGRIWAGGYNGLDIIDPNTFKTEYYSAKNGLPSNIVTVILEDKDKNIWIGTDNGLVLYRDEVVEIFNEKSGLKSSSITSLFEDSNGVLWIGTYRGGVNIYSDGVFKDVLYSKILATHEIYKIYEDKEGKIWITTNSGLFILKNGQAFHISQKDGLYHERVVSLLEDDEGFFWMSSNVGVFKVKKIEIENFIDGKIKKVNSIVFTKADGLKSVDCYGNTNPPSFQFSNGSLAFPTTKGVAIADPYFNPDRFIPPLYIDLLKANDELVNSDREITLSALTDKVEISYHALRYKLPEKINYFYKLDGFDKEWVSAGNRRTAYYTNLPPGDYRFKVKFENENGALGNSDVSLKFTKKPHFYQTTIFYIFLFLFTAFIIYMVYKRRVKYMRRKNEELQEIVEVKTEELQVVSEELKEKFEEKFEEKTEEDFDPSLYAKYLKEYMEKEKPYRDSSLSLKTVADGIGVPSYLLSKILNQHINQNFYNFVNSYRIKELMELLKDPELTKQYTILAIAFDAGFKTKSTFNTLFKKTTGMTPSEYRDKYSQK